MSENALKAIAIIPAFNEGERVADVVRIAIESNVFFRVVVVDDGSSDDTATVAKEAGAQVISHEANKGKPWAMLTGIVKTDEPVICFLDADLKCILPAMICELVQPVIDGSRQATIAVFSGGRLATTLAQKISPLISGQRCITRQVLIGFDDWDSGFGIETAINAFLRKQGIDMEIVKWDGATHIMKEEKRGFLRGLLARIRMYWEILKTWFRMRK